MDGWMDGYDDLQKPDATVKAVWTALDEDQSGALDYWELRTIYLRAYGHPLVPPKFHEFLDRLRHRCSAHNATAASAPVSAAASSSSPASSPATATAAMAASAVLLPSALEAAPSAAPLLSPASTNVTSTHHPALASGSQQQLPSHVASATAASPAATGSAEQWSRYSNRYGVHSPPQRCCVDTRTTERGKEGRQAMQ
jgi:hypothetical protein